MAGMFWERVSWCSLSWPQTLTCFRTPVLGLQAWTTIPGPRFSLPRRPFLCSFSAPGTPDCNYKCSQWLRDALCARGAFLLIRFPGIVITNSLFSPEQCPPDTHFSIYSLQIPTVCAARALTVSLEVVLNANSHLLAARTKGQPRQLPLCG